MHGALLGRIGIRADTRSRMQAPYIIGTWRKMLRSLWVINDNTARFESAHPEQGGVLAFRSLAFVGKACVCFYGWVEFPTLTRDIVSRLSCFSRA